MCSVHLDKTSQNNSEWQICRLSITTTTTIYVKETGWWREREITLYFGFISKFELISCASSKGLIVSFTVHGLHCLSLQLFHDNDESLGSNLVLSAWACLNIVTSPTLLVWRHLQSVYEINPVQKQISANREGAGSCAVKNPAKVGSNTEPLGIFLLYIYIYILGIYLLYIYLYLYL